MVRDVLDHGLTLVAAGTKHGVSVPTVRKWATRYGKRRCHHLTFYGFLLCFAATCVATAYHYFLGWPAPYPYASAPKVLGIVGGISLVLGTTGLFVLNLRRHPLQQDKSQHAMDRGFIALLFLTAASGLVLMMVGNGRALPVTLCIHLGAVMALVLTMPYGKFAHAVYRAAALVKWPSSAGSRARYV